MTEINSPVGGLVLTAAVEREHKIKVCEEFLLQFTIINKYKEIHISTGIHGKKEKFAKKILMSPDSETCREAKGTPIAVQPFLL